jgi:hypothetical protein
VLFGHPAFMLDLGQTQATMLLYTLLGVEVGHRQCEVEPSVIEHLRKHQGHTVLIFDELDKVAAEVREDAFDVFQSILEYRVVKPKNHGFPHRWLRNAIIVFTSNNDRPPNETTSERAFAQRVSNTYAYGMPGPRDLAEFARWHILRAAEKESNTAGYSARCSCDGRADAVLSKLAERSAGYAFRDMAKALDVALNARLATWGGGLTSSLPAVLDATDLVVEVARATR